MKWILLTALLVASALAADDDQLVMDIDKAEAIGKLFLFRVLSACNLLSLKDQQRFIDPRTRFLATYLEDTRNLPCGHRHFRRIFR